MDLESDKPQCYKKMFVFVTLIIVINVINVNLIIKHIVDNKKF